MDPTRRELFAAPLAGLAPDTLSQQVKELTCLVATLTDQLATVREELSQVIKASPPVGTVASFLGPSWSHEHEVRLGWALCDGRTVSGPEFDQLIQILGSNKLPNLLGMFLRGHDVALDGTRRGSDKEKELRNVGHEQTYATAHPRNKFQTASSGEGRGVHSHAVTGKVAGANRTFDRLVMSGRGVGGTVSWVTDGNGGGEEPYLYDSKAMGPGEHVHIVSEGGDAETRPVNVCVRWIIKYGSGKIGA